MSKKLSGIAAPISTPFVNGDIAYDRLRSNVQKYSETALAGFFALGSNGESMFLTESEKLKILEVVLHEKADHQMVRYYQQAHSLMKEDENITNKINELVRKSEHLPPAHRLRERPVGGAVKARKDAESLSALADHGRGGNRGDSRGCPHRRLRAARPAVDPDSGSRHP